jgi:TonB family protein
MRVWCWPTTSRAGVALAAALALACASAPEAVAPALEAAGPAEDAAARWWGEREVDFPARPLAPIAPAYPPEAREQSREGNATLLVYVRADGKVVGTKPLASDAREFAHAAAVAIRATPFGPGTRRREPVNSTVTIQVRFRLD